jgi:hypothetical protein
VLVPRLTGSLTLYQAQLPFLPEKELKYIYGPRTGQGHRTGPQGHRTGPQGHRTGPQGHHQDHKDRIELKGHARTRRPKN